MLVFCLEFLFRAVSYLVYRKQVVTLVDLFVSTANQIRLQVLAGERHPAIEVLSNKILGWIFYCWSSTTYQTYSDQCLRRAVNFRFFIHAIKIIRKLMAKNGQAPNLLSLILLALLSRSPAIVKFNFWHFLKCREKKPSFVPFDALKSLETPGYNFIGQ